MKVNSLNKIKLFLHEFILFGIKQARACVFAGSFFVLLFLSNHIPLFGFHRYDFLFVAAVLIQIILVLTKIETKDEAKTIFLFHIIGLCLELYKTHPAVGSWSYPEPGFFKISTVPLYSGFMYAAVGSYISQAWRIFTVELKHFPAYKFTIPLCALIYINFFTDNFFFDFRWILLELVIVLFFKTQVEFIVVNKTRQMPLVLSFLLIAFFIWIAENISTYLGAWKYPDQIHQWNVVSFDKISSWTLLVIISFILVADLKQLKKQKTHFITK